MSATKARQWYRFDNAAEDPSIADIHIVDFIGDWIDDYWGLGVTARAFIEQLAKLPEAVKTIRVHINSPGGDVFGAINIANALREQQASKGRTVETIVDGLAASAASIILMAGSTVRIADNGLVMVHNPWTIGIGNAADMRKVADELDTVRNTIVATYKWHSSLEDDEIVALMDAETWLDADEAIAKGFATEKVEGLKAAASIDPKAAAKLKVPEKFKARIDAFVKQPDAPPAAPVAAAATDVLRICREGGVLDLAEDLIKAGATLEQVTAKVTTEKTARAAAATRATEIRALCGAAKLPELADGYINGAMSLDDIRVHLTTLTAKLDGPALDGTLPIDRGVDVGASWDRAFKAVNPQRRVAH